MGLFVYSCKDCGLKFETISFWKDKENTKCPKCGSSQVIESLSLFGLVRGGPAQASQSGSTGGCGSRGGFT